MIQQLYKKSRDVQKLLTKNEVLNNSNNQMRLRQNKQCGILRKYLEMTWTTTAQLFHHPLTSISVSCRLDLCTTLHSLLLLATSLFFVNKFCTPLLFLYNCCLVKLKLTSYDWLMLPNMSIFGSRLLLISELSYQSVTYLLTFPRIFKTALSREDNKIREKL